MRAILVLTCLAWSGEARRLQKAEEHAERHRAPAKSLSSALLASKHAAAFKPASLARPVQSRSGQLSMATSLRKGNDVQNKLDVQQMAGITEPLGFWDPLGFSEGKADGRLRFYREVELKHGRVAMLAALGFLVGEQFHPLFGGGIDSPAYRAFQETPLETFWPLVVAAIAIPEIYSVFTFVDPAESKSLAKGEQWLIREDHEAGDFGFDPLNLKPEDPAELKEMQTKELNNGRLAMIAAAGMIAQELATGQKLF